MSKVEIIKQKGHNFLWVDDYLWMWDIPEERKDQEEIAQQAFRDVLMAGYGLGLVQEYLLENEKVNSLLSIEEFKEVIEECKKVYGKIYGKIEIGDFYDYFPSQKFDCIIGDIWPDQALRHIEDYIKFKNKAKILLKEGGKILGWGMDYFEYLLESKNSSAKTKEFLERGGEQGSRTPSYANRTNYVSDSGASTSALLSQLPPQ